MKTKMTMNKTMLLALLLAAALLLSACNLVVKDPVVDAAQVILSVNGEEVDKATFQRYYNNALGRAYEEQSYYAQFAQYGMQVPEVKPQDVLMATLDNTAKDLVLHQKAKELGLDVLNEEQAAAVEAKAQENYADILSQIKDYYFAGTELTGEALDQAIADKAVELELDLAVFQESAKEENLHERLHDYAGRDISVSEEEIQADFDAKAEADATRFAENPASFGDALTQGQAIYAAPAGYRYVQQILVKISDEDDAAIKALEAELSPLKSALDSAQAAWDRAANAWQAQALEQADVDFLVEQYAGLEAADNARIQELLKKEGLSAEESAELDALKAKLPIALALQQAKDALLPKQEEVDAKKAQALSSIRGKADEVYALASAEGADFAALQAEHNEDPGTPEPGYAVSLASTNWVPSFTQASMALTEPGQVGQPQSSDFGWHIIKYISDVQEGPVALDSVRDTIHDQIFHSKQDAVYQALEDEWMAAASIQTYPERMAD